MSLNNPSYPQASVVWFFVMTNLSNLKLQPPAIRVSLIQMAPGIKALLNLSISDVGLLTELRIEFDLVDHF